MASWELAIDVDAPPETTWAFVGDPTTVPQWYPKYVGCTVDGDTRVLRNAEGGELVERLVDRDDEARSYSYSVLSGAPVSDHLATFRVDAAGAGSRITWSTSAESDRPGDDLAERLRPTQSEALRRIKEIVESGAAGS